MKCMVCGFNNWRFLFYSKDRMFGIPGQFRVVRCRFCLLTRIDPTPSQILLKKYYGKHYYAYGSNLNPGFFWHLRSYLILHSRHPTVLSRILGLVIQVPAIPAYVAKGKILDVGCGSGDTLSLLKKLGWVPYGLEIDRNAVKVARQRGLQNVHLGSYREMAKYPDNFFDVIRLYLVIEHLDHPDLCLRLIRRKIKKGGQVIIGTANIDSPVAKLWRSFWYHLDTPRHLYLFTPKNLTQLLYKFSFRDIRVSYCSIGGWVGSLQYVLGLQLINRSWMILLFYPLERFLDWLGKGDIFVLQAKKHD